MSAVLESIRQARPDQTARCNGRGETTFSRHAHQGIEHKEPANVQNLHAVIEGDGGNAAVKIKPFPLWVLVVHGVVIFIVAFCWARYTRNVTDQSPIVSETSRSPANVQPVRTDSATNVGSAVADANVPAVVHVVIKNMKFNPPTLEVKTGDVVEWKNDDITPHTATFRTFDSGTIDPDKTWRHTFTEPGSFPYSCTFHPDMKATITVK